ncbi:uncharacterized protein LOC107042778 [Diachasma alloeum]|uniref:uncharacterized protein LOC107042778 n=1 Tax=Diachasma alloeum TaxID=454923 RepID=UPI000738233E|nr:uncharacterized protein LOC107042778 [Diachasma alloeum]
MRLPELDTVKFDGSYENWPAFIDSYNCNIEQHPDLSKVQKLQHLRSRLTGKAAKVIDALKNTTENYDTAMEMLKKKYDCERKIVSRHWWILHDIPTTTKKTLEALGNLVDTFNQHIRSLQNLKQPVDQSDLALICMIQSKISPEILTHWELKIKDSKLPKYTSLLEFLENRSQCSAPIDSSTSNERSNHYKRGKQAFLSSEITCTICNEGHKIGKCPTFKALSPAERYKAAKQASLCINCLGANHDKQQCISRFDCNHCHERHHTLLHFKEKSAVGNPVSKPPVKPAAKAPIQPPTENSA